MSNEGRYPENRKADSSLMDTVIEVIDAIKGGMAGAARNSANPNKEATRAQQRTKQREGKAYGGRTKMMCGGKAKK